MPGVRDAAVPASVATVVDDDPPAPGPSDVGPRGSEGAGVTITELPAAVVVGAGRVVPTVSGVVTVTVAVGGDAAPVVGAAAAGGCDPQASAAASSPATTGPATTRNPDLPTSPPARRTDDARASDRRGSRMSMSTHDP
jgi:hypothetical protein